MLTDNSVPLHQQLIRSEVKSTLTEAKFNGPPAVPSPRRASFHGGRAAKRKMNEKKYTVHHPGTVNLYRLTGINRWVRKIEIIDTDDVVPTRTLSRGALLIEGNRKLRCNVRDNTLGIWLRVDYAQLVDDGDGCTEGRITTYSVSDGSTDHEEDSTDASGDHPGLRRHRYTEKLIGHNLIVQKLPHLKTV